MKNKYTSRCSECYFYGQCVAHGSCKYFSPIYNDEYDDRTRQLEEKLKKEFYWAWLEYTSDFN